MKKVISFRLDEKNIAILDKLATQEDRSRSYIVNRLIELVGERMKSGGEKSQPQSQQPAVKTERSGLARLLDARLMGELK